MTEDNDDPHIEDIMDFTATDGLDFEVSVDHHPTDELHFPIAIEVYAGASHTGLMLSIEDAERLSSALTKAVTNAKANQQPRKSRRSHWPKGMS